MALGLEYFAGQLALKHGISKSEAYRIMETLRDEMRARAAEGHTIRLTEFGSIARKKQAARTSPKGVKIPEKWRFVFKASKLLKKRANGGVK